jgi:hypothetical protein
MFRVQLHRIPLKCGTRRSTHDGLLPLKELPQKLLLELGELSTWTGNLTRHALARILRPQMVEVKATSGTGRTY